jgi:hypothetical protein
VNVAYTHHARPAYDQRRWLQGKIHDVAKRLGMPEQDRRDFMMDLVGENSCRDMTHPQLKKVLWALTHKTDRSPSHRPVTAMTPIGDVVRKTTDYILKKSAVGSGGGPAGRAPSRSGRDERLPDEISTIEQTRMIEHLFADIETMNPGRLARTWRTGFCKRQCGRVWPQTRAQANKIIEALKSMRDRHWHPKEKEAVR